MSKVLFFDIDGTLVDYHGNMPASTRMALKQARQEGHQVVICSGRAKFQMTDDLLKLADGIVGCAGAYVEYRGKVLYEHFMPKETVERVCGVLETASALAAGMSEKTTYMNRECYEYMIHKFADEFGLGEQIRRVMGETVITDRLNDFPEIKKILYYESCEGVSKIAGRLEDLCDVTASSFEDGVDDSGEISCKGINKSYGMKRYIAYQNIPREDTIAFGDGPNDVDMIEYADIGVVMGNGREELKKFADFITKDIDKDGIYHALKTLHLIP